MNDSNLAIILTHYERTASVSIDCVTFGNGQADLKAARSHYRGAELGRVLVKENWVSSYPPMSALEPLSSVGKSGRSAHLPPAETEHSMSPLAKKIVEERFAFCP